MQNERAAKAHEFSEAQQYIGRLMDVMGFKRDTAEVEDRGRHQGTLAHQNPTSEITPEKNNTEDSRLESFLENSFELSTPGYSGGRRTKRVRSDALGATSAIPMPSRSKSSEQQISESPIAIGRKQNRVPLGSVDQNLTLSKRQPTKVSSPAKNHANTSRPVGANDNNQVVNTVNDMELDLDHGSIFASTPLPEMNDTTLAMMSTQDESQG